MFEINTHDKYDAFLTVDPKHGRLMGGETCMWGEWVDDTNVIQFIW